MHVMRKSLAIKLGYSTDKKRRRRQHRKAAKYLRAERIFDVARWHLNQARYL